MEWVTREHPKTDRIACPWLIRKFIDPDAVIVYVPRDEVLSYAERTGAISFDAPGARYTHRDGLCSFEVLVEDFAIADKHPEHNMRVDGVERLTVGAEPSRCWTATHPGGPELGYYAPKTHVCLHETLFLPTLVEAWDATSRLVEHYTWGDYVTNVGLTDADFDVDNPSYGF